MTKINFFFIYLALVFTSQNAFSNSDLDSLRQAAEQGDIVAQFQLGTFSYTGQKGPPNYQEAAQWYRKVAEQGFAAAQHNLGVMYSQGQGVSQDYAEAFGWYRKAAAQGDRRAQNNLGNMYRKGQGILQNPEEAVKWYRQAAEQEYALAQYNLGVAYSRGEGVSNDPQEALKWYRKAAAQGSVKAQQELAYLGKVIPNENQDYSTSDSILSQDSVALANSPTLPTETPPNSTPKPVSRPLIPQSSRNSASQAASTPLIPQSSSLHNSATILEVPKTRIDKSEVSAIKKLPQIEPSLEVLETPIVQSEVTAIKKLPQVEDSVDVPEILTAKSTTNNSSTLIEIPEIPLEKPEASAIKKLPQVERSSEEEVIPPQTDSSAQVSKPLDKIPSETQKRTRQKYLIALNYKQKKDKPFMKQLAQYLENQGYTVDRIERVRTKVYKQQWDIRYYYDRNMANELKESLQDFIQTHEEVDDVHIQVKDFSFLLKPNIKIRRGRLEVWILNP